MGEKTAGVGHFTIPTAPSAGVSCTSGAANVFTTTYVQLIASTSAALFITGIYLEEAAASGATYIVVQLATGGAGSESIVGQYLIPPSTGSTVTRGYRPIYPPIPVANATRIACKTADSVGAAAKLITLECIAQSNVVDDGVAVGTVTNLTNAPTAGDFTAAMKTSLNAATPASVTGAVGSVTAAVTLPSIPANWITAAGITAAALNGKGDWNIGKTGYSLTQTFPGNFASMSITAGGLVDITQAAADKAWSTAARVLTAGTNIALAKGVGVTGFNDPTAAAIRAEIDANSVGLAAIFARTDVATSTRLASASYTVPPTEAVIADKLLGRNLAGGLDGGRTMADAMRALRNKTSLAAGVLTVYAEDDATPAWTANVTQAARDPITAVDPA